MTSDLGKKILELIKNDQITLEEGTQLIKGIRHNNSTSNRAEPLNLKQNLSSRLNSNIPQFRDIAIIGLSGTFPEASDVNEYWHNLTVGKDSVREIPANRWTTDGFYDQVSNTPHADYRQWGGFLSDIDCFDPTFFNISPKEAELMDPQQRRFLQEAWSALEDAGYPPKALARKKCGVFVGCAASDYLFELTANKVPSDAYSLVGNTASILAARISYVLNLKGPSIAIDTACSSSLVAVHLACESIQSGTSELALAGGITMFSTPLVHILSTQAGMLSPTGKCRTFDARADGMALGEGVGVVVLKPLELALKAGDHIYGVIKGSGINQDGKTHSGITVPSASAQSELECEVYSQCNINPETISYVEAHGTGTPLGDPIEIEALTKAFRKYTQQKQYCAIGSVKTNIGHTQIAAGIAGLIKLLLCLKHKTLVPSLHLETENEHINFKESPFYVNTQLKEWKTKPDIPRRAAISSFGMSGTNAHLVIEEYEKPSPSLSGFTPQLIVLSAKKEAQLQAYAKKIINFLNPVLATGTSNHANAPENITTFKRQANLSLTDFAYSLQVGRDAMVERLAMMVDSLEEVRDKLTQYLQGQTEIESFYHGNVKTSQTQSELLIEGKAGEAFLSMVIEEKELNKLAQLWISGVEIDWQLLYPNQKPQRISLPTYPFARERYWIPISQPKAKTTDPLSAVKTPTTTQYYQSVWEKTPLEISKPTTSGLILLFDLDETRYFEIQQQKIGEIILVKPGNSYQKLDSNIYCLNPTRKTDYHQLLTSLSQHDQWPHHIIHLWSQARFVDETAALNVQLEMSLYSIFHITQALLEQKPFEPVQLLYAYLEQVPDSQPQYAALSGFAKTIGLENPKWIYKTVALPTLDEAENLLLAEFKTVDELEVRYSENNQRWVKRLQEFKGHLDLETRPLLKENGVYLITGGAGGLGLIFAEYLAKHYKAKLVLTGRSELTADKNKKIQSLNAGGAELIYLQADIGKRDNVESIIAQTKSRFNQINGIIHSAGVIRDALVVNKTEQNMAAVLASKVYGTVYLDDVTKTEQLDFFVVFSSIVAVLGNPGQCDYAYANSFMDHFVAWREGLRLSQKRFGKTLSINWSLWQGGGMHVDEQSKKWLAKTWGMQAITPVAGLEAFIKGLAIEPSQLLVISGKRQKINRSLGLESPQPENKEPRFTGETIKRQIESTIKNLASKILKINPQQLDTSENLGYFGFDSISLKEFADKLSNTFSIELSPSVFFAHSSLQSLRTYLLQEFSSQMKDFYVTETETPPLGDSYFENEDIPQPHARKKENQIDTNRGSQAIAIIGAHGIFPGSKDLSAFWHHLENEHDLITEVPIERWDWREYYGDPAQDQNKTHSKWGGFIPDVDKFDPLFFKLSPFEAEMMDPQHRLFIESVWKAIEDAGYRASVLSGTSVGVFVGAEFNDYMQLLANQGKINAQVAIGNSQAMLANRVSFLLNLHGPSEVIDTACSSSLVAVHQAVNSIQRGESELAIAGGVSLMLSPKTMIGVGQLGVLSPDGKCKTFDKSANGYVKGEGVGVVLLKPLCSAIADNDNIYAVIKGSATNHGGKASSLTAPNSTAQATLLTKVYLEAGIAPDTVTYLEMHGTGTELGDPAEVEGIKMAFKELASKQQRLISQNYYCGLGSVKTNIGHLEPAAGIAGLLKVILAMRHQKLPATLHLQTLNPYIDLKETPFYVVEKNQTWNHKKDEKGHSIPRRAGVSSFGFGGANAHVVLEEYESPERLLSNSNTPQLFVLSAKNEERLSAYVLEIRDFLTSEQANGAVEPQRKVTEKVEFRLQVQQDLLKVVSEILKVNDNDIDLDEALSELGFDMLSLTELSDCLNEKYLVSLTPARLSGYSSLAAVVRDLCEKSQEPLKETTLISNNLSLADLAYTLQVGREAMEERLAMVVSGVDSILEKLTQYAKGQTEIDDFYRGHLKMNKAQSELLIEGEEGREFVKSIIKNKKLTKLAQLWVSGVEFDWQLLYGNPKPQRLSLPTYPFARERYWIPVSKQIANTRPLTPNNAPKPQILEKTWQESFVLNHTNLPLTGTMIILVNEETLAVAHQLFQNEAVTTIIIQTAAQGLQIAKDLLEKGETLAGFIDLSDLQTAKRTGSLDKITLLQTLIKNHAPLHILHFTKGLQIFETKQPTLAGADFAGLIKMLSAEYQKVQAKTIDIDDNANLNSIIHREWQTIETEICYRNGKRYIPDLKTVFPLHSRQHGMTINPEKVIVITGGTRGIGSVVATHLVEKGARKLVLMGVQTLPEREQWESVRQDTTADPSVVNKIKRLIALEKKGAQIALYTGVLTQPTPLRDFFAQIRQTLGEIGGVIHCAGLVSSKNPAFINKQLEDMQKVFEPKIAGLEILHEIFAEDSLDFFVLFSSVSALIPRLAISLSDYATANAFMDYFAAYQATQGKTYYKSIQWPSWKEVGMGEIKSPLYNQLGFISHSTKDGLVLLDSIMEFKNKTNLMPCLVDGAKFVSEQLLFETETPSRVSQEVPRIKSTLGDNTDFQTRQWLRELFAKELKIPEMELDADTTFGDFGVDSIFLAELVKKIENWLGETLEPSILIEYPTFNQLSHYLNQTFNEAIKAKLNVVMASTAMPLSSSPSEMNTRTSASTSPKIAVIGLACHFPGAKNKDRYWENLATGRNSVIEVPSTRWNSKSLYDATPQTGKTMSKWGGFLEGIEEFDPDYFNIPQEDAPYIDPLVRQFLEVSTQCFRDAGFAKKELWGSKIGVFVGSRVTNFAERIKQPSKNSIVGTGQNFIAAHISHFFNLKGPSLVVDTACSSSLVSIHLACQSLILNESEMVLAGGVDILLDEKPYLLLSEGKALSPDGQCHTFDEKANGFVPGEGCGAVLLKPLEKAIIDGDKIYAIIEASAVNNDGQTMGITTPNPEAQQEVIQEALNKGGINANSISYVETHGTGTLIGDPIELKALTKAFRQSTQEIGFCRVGSVKTNIGHLLSAAGIASFIKVVLSIQHKQLPPTLNCETPNPRFDFSNSPFYPNTSLKEWVAREGIRRAGISSFGFGGTNAHLIVSECDTQLLENYQPRRKALSPVVFNKKRYWVDKNIVHEPSLAKEIPSQSNMDVPFETKRPLLKLVIE